MSILGKILGGVFRKKEATPAAPAPEAAAPTPAPAPTAAAVAPQPAAEVDVAGILDFMNEQRA